MTESSPDRKQGSLKDSAQHRNYTARYCCTAANYIWPNLAITLAKWRFIIEDNVSGKGRMMMAIFLVIGTAGFVLGLHFKVFVLAPAFLLIAAVIISSGIVTGHSSFSVALAMSGTLASLEIGYLVGCALQAHQYAPRDAIA